jgi:hypothetical protein
VLIHLSREEILNAAFKDGDKVIGDAVFSTLLQAHQFIQNLGRGDLEVKQLGTSAFIIVLSSKE